MTQIRTLLDKYRPVFLGLLFLSISFGAAGQTYNPSVCCTVSNKAYGAAQSVSTDGRSWFYDATNFVMRDYNGTTEVFFYLNLAKYRSGHFPIFVHTGGILQGNGVWLGGSTLVYWFKDSTGNANLVRWYTDSTGNPGGPFYAVANNLSEGNAGLIKGNLALDLVNNTSDAQKNAATVSLTNHTIDANNNTLLHIPNSALTNNTIGLTLTATGSDVSIPVTPAALGGSVTINIPSATPSVRGVIPGSDWTSFHGKVDSTTQSNDTVYDWHNGTKIFRYVILGGGAGISSLNGLTTSVQTFATGTTGSDFNILSSVATHTFNFPNANASNRGLLIPADWSTFNLKEPPITPSNTIDEYWNGYKQFVALNTDSITEGSNHLFFTNTRARAAISLTTAGTTGPSTYNNTSGVLNVPNYSGGGCVACLLSANNLSDVANITTSQNNIGLASLTETGIGTIYNVSSWPDTLDFKSKGVTIGTNGNFITLASTGSSLTTYVSVLGEQIYPQWFMSADIKMTDISAGSAGIGIGVSSDVSVVPDDNVMAALATTTGTSPGIAINNTAGNITTGTGPNFSVNDIVRITAQFQDSVFTMTIQNMTTISSIVTLTHTYTAGGSPSLPTFGHFAIYNFGGNHELHNLFISSASVKNANLLVLGNSISQYYFTNSIAGGYTYQLNANYPSVSNFSGSGGSTIELEKSIRAILKYSPKQVLMASPAQNQLRAGAALTDAAITYDSVRNLLTAAGMQVYDCVFPEDSTAGGIGQTLWNAYLKAKYATTYIDTYDSLSTNNILKTIYAHGDGVHLNQLGDNKIYQTIVVSGKIKTLNPYAAQLVATDSYLKFARDSLFADTASFIKLVKRNSAGSVPSLNTVLGVGNTSSTAILLSGYNSTGANLQAADFTIQNFALNNGFITDNIFFNGSNIKYKNTGYGSYMQFFNGQTLLGGDPSGTGGATAVNNTSLKTDYAGNVDLGGNIASNLADHSGSVMSISPTTISINNSGGAQLANLDLTNQAYQFVSSSSSAKRGLISRQASSDINGAMFYAEKSRGSLASPTAVNTGDFIATFHTSPFDGSGFVFPAFWGYQVNGSVSTGIVPTDLVFNTGNGVIAGGQERLRVSSVGIYTIPSSSFATGSSSDSVVVETTSSGIMTLKKVAQSSVGTVTNIYNSDGTLTGNRTLDGSDSHFSLNLGNGSGNNINALNVNAINGVNLTASAGAVSFVGNMNYKYASASNTNFDLTTITGIGIELPTITANRTITLPSPSGNTQVYDLFNTNTAGFTWTFASTVKDLNGNTITAFPNGSHYRIYSNSTNWYILDQLVASGQAIKYQHTIFTPTTGGTVNLVNGQYNIINPAGALLALTVNLPSSPLNNDVVYIKFTQNVTTVTYANGTVVDGITAPTAGGLTVLTYDAGTTSWY